METRSQVKSKLKREHENDVNEERKSQRLASSPAEPELTTKITDLNDDCLMKVFGYLDVQSLFNVAIANAFLRPAACDVYKRKFGENKVVLFILKPLIVTQRGYIDGTEYSALRCVFDDILCAGLKTCLQYLRYFGPFISNLVIDYELSESKYFKPVHQYVNDYCGENLVQIKFVDMPNVAIEDEFQEIFTNVEEAEIDGDNLGQQWSSFAKCFPNLRRLDMQQVEVNTVSRPTGKPFQFLEELFVYNVYSNVFKANEIVGDLLNGAHQLKRLRITMAYDDLSIDELLTMIKDCPSINSFEFSLGELCSIPVDSTDIQRIFTEYPALVELILTDYRFTAANAIALIRQLNSLKEFVFQMEKSEYSDLVSRLNGDEWEVIVDDDLGLGDDNIGVTLKCKM